MTDKLKLHCVLTTYDKRVILKIKFELKPIASFAPTKYIVWDTNSKTSVDGMCNVVFEKLKEETLDRKYILYTDIVEYKKEYTSFVERQSQTIGETIHNYLKVRNQVENNKKTGSYVGNIILMEFAGSIDF